MKEKLLTIIIPTYNMERLLPQCLSSLVIEEDDIFAMLEVLVIIDGATDSSSKIAHSFHDAYPAVFRVIDKENGNYGSCVNRGLSEATGKYIKILDADDRFDKEILKNVMLTIKELDVDMVLTNFKTIDETGKVLNEHKFMLPNREVLSSNILNSDTGAHMTMHAVMYRTKNLRDIAYKQTEGISYTDQEWIYEPMTTVKSFYYIGEPLYLYLVGREGQTIDISVMKKNMRHNLVVMSKMIKVYECIPEGQNIQLYLSGRIKCFAESIYTKYLLNANELDLRELKDFDKSLKSTSPRLYDFMGKLKAGKLPFVRIWRLLYYNNDYGFNRYFAERKYRLLILGK